jgi:splicing factor 3B subunit 3
MQALPAAAESLCIVEMGAGETGGEGEPGTTGSLYLNIGLQNGVLLRTVLDQVTGDLADTRTRYLGSRPVKLFRIRMQGSEAVSVFRIYAFICEQGRRELVHLIENLSFSCPTFHLGR